jgi:uroporphyrinogen-III synthase
MGARDLAGITVLVTRPAGQAEAFARAIEERGGVAFRFPTIEILPPSEPDIVRAQLARIGDADFAIFVSANAVAQAHALLGPEKIPARVRLAAVGTATAEALRLQGYGDILAPAGRQDSEGIAALPEFAAMRGTRIVILRGAGGGREWLAETLAARGADVHYVECYRRVPSGADPLPLRAALGRGAIGVATATSIETLDGLMRVAGDDARSALVRLPIICASARIGTHARSLGFHNVHVAPSAGTAAMTESLQRWRDSL